jgi:hypothetical protein
MTEARHKRINMLSDSIYGVHMDFKTTKLIYFIKVRIEVTSGAEQKLLAKKKQEGISEKLELFHTFI